MLNLFPFRYWRPSILRDIFTIELPLAFFLYSGLVKSVPGFTSLNNVIDLTLFFGVPTFVVAILNLLRKKQVITRDLLVYLVGFFLFCTYAIFSFFYSEPDLTSTKKLLQLCALGGASIIMALGIFYQPMQIECFLFVTLIFGTAASMYNIVILLNIWGVMSLDFAESYQWISRIAFISFSIGLVYFTLLKGVTMRLVWLCIMLISFFGMIAGGARQAIISTGVVIAYLIYSGIVRGRLKFKIHRVIFSLGVTILIGGISYIIFFNQINLLISMKGAQRIINFLQWSSSLSLEQSLELSGRATPFHDGINIFFEFPIIGSGFGMFSHYASTFLYSHPHNIILEILSELGLVGIMLFIVMTIPVAKTLLNRRQIKSNSPYTIALSTIVIGYMTMMLVSGDLGTNRLIFFFMPLLLLAKSQNKRFAALEKYENYGRVARFSRVIINPHKMHSQRTMKV